MQPPSVRRSVYTHIRENPWLWYAVLVGPLAWTVHLLLSYALVGLTCATGWTVILHAVTVATAAVTAVGVVVSAPRWVSSKTDQVGRTVVGEGTGYQRFMAALGCVQSLVFVYVIVLEGLPVFFLDPCTSFTGSL